MCHTHPAPDPAHDQLGRDVRDQVVERSRALPVAEVERLERVVQERRHLAESPAHELLDHCRSGRVGLGRRRQLRDERHRAARSGGAQPLGRTIDSDPHALEERHARRQVARAEAESAARRQDAIRRITDAALSPLALEDLLRELLGRITDVLGVDGAAVMLGEGDEGQVVVQAAGEAATTTRPSDPRASSRPRSAAAP